MASSFIDIKEIGFWANDGFVEAMQLCLINEIESKNLDTIKWFNNFKIQLALQSIPMIYGGMSMQLEEFLLTDERKTQIIELIDIIIEKINSMDNYLTGSNLHRMRTRSMKILSENGELNFKNEEDFKNTVNSSRWEESQNIPKIKHRYQHSFKLLKKLINGEMSTTAGSPENYWNY